jgi:glucose-1-phosphate thymidylyltransferase
MGHTTEKIVVLAAGLGKRMRQVDALAQLDERQKQVAQTGVKALIPIDLDRPFLDYVLTSVAAAGCRRVCLVVGPRHDQIRRYYSEQTGGRLVFEFAVQREPLGTANALLAAEEFVAADDFLTINSDNYYPTAALAALRELGDFGAVGFRRGGLVSGGNIPPERIASFAIMRTGQNGRLDRIVEKPGPDELAAGTDDDLISMNCWSFRPAIFEACRAIPPSPRGEFEIPDAVAYSIDKLRHSYRVVLSDEPVLDLSSRCDVKPVAERLRGIEVRL